MSCMICGHLQQTIIVDQEFNILGDADFMKKGFL